MGIYHNYHSEISDIIIPLLRNTYTWIPYFVVITYIIFKQYEKSSFVIVVIIFILGIVMSDQISAHVLKPFFGRPRPCQILDIQPLVDCGTGYSFPSAHASNYFTLAFLIQFFLSGYKFKFIAITIAVVVGSAQIYVGVHFPTDIIGGFILGLIIASIVYLVSNKYIVHKLKPKM
jgi:undecaprenyl-diphosphatase